MKGYVFNTPFYTKTNWHDGKLILSRNGQTKGFGEPGSMKYERRTSAAQAMIGEFGTTGTTSYGGKRIGMNAFKLASNSQMNQSFGGQAKKDEIRQLKHKEAMDRLGNSGRAGRSGRF